MSSEIAHTILSVRAALGLTQAQFCAVYNATEPRRLRIHQSVLSRYENGRVIPPTDKYLKLLDLLEKEVPGAGTD